MRGNLAAQVKPLKEHISKGDKVLYVMADKILTKHDQTALLEQFERIEAEEIGEGVQENYHRIAEELGKEG